MNQTLNETNYRRIEQRRKAEEAYNNMLRMIAWREKYAMHLARNNKK